MSWPSPDQDRLYFDQIMRQTEDAMRHLRTAKQLIGQVAGTGVAADGFIKVTAGAGGTLSGIDLDPRLLRLPPAVIGRELTKAVRAAQDDAERRSREIVDEAAPYVEALPEPLDETFVRRRVDAAMRDLLAGDR
ncbi:YbaB/EbfC family nucleoid-associated protein [Nonomuraea sp. NPDC004580]|uniref:YbaB/EbfC family nucleoid-associated protein n=1 Tax=Nonomuraea sp. NPDC004580 TaxID=3154552 RepID=UPI0033B6E239